MNDLQQNGHKIRPTPEKLQNTVFASSLFWFPGISLDMWRILSVQAEDQKLAYCEQASCRSWGYSTKPQLCQTQGPEKMVMRTLGSKACGAEVDLEPQAEQKP